MRLRIGSLFSGAGGLDMAVEAVFNGQTAWHSELELITERDGKTRHNAAVDVLAHRWPSVPNLGDISAIDWATVEPIDVLCGGFPCQDVSVAAADRRRGLATGTRSGLWSEFAQSIAALHPKFVVIENVRGLLNARANRTVEPRGADMGDTPGGSVLRAIGAVLGDLASLGYDAVWATVSAADIGAPHKRERVFIVAHPQGYRWNEGRPKPAGLIGGSHAPVGRPAAVELLPTPTTRDHKGANQRGDDTCLTGALLPTPSASDGIGGGPNDPVSRLENGHQVQLIDLGMRDEVWGRYTAAIEWWGALTRPAPNPTEPSPRGKYGARLNPAFSEWMMGWPAGWVTEVPGISRNDQLRIIGNGVVPQQAYAALQWLLKISEVAA